MLRVGTSDPNDEKSISVCASATAGIAKSRSSICVASRSRSAGVISPRRACMRARIACLEARRLARSLTRWEVRGSTLGRRLAGVSSLRSPALYMHPRDEGGERRKLALDPVRDFAGEGEHRADLLG